MPITARIIPTAAAVAVLVALGACSTRRPPPPAATGAPPPPAAEAPPPSSGGPPPVAQRQTGPVPGSEADFVANAGDRVYFETDESTVNADARRVLDLQASWLARYPGVQIRIEGNADERGTREYNLALGARRAESVRAYLASRGVTASRVSTISYGKERPIDGGSGEESWAKNRNAHTTLVSGAAG